MLTLRAMPSQWWLSCSLPGLHAGLLSEALALIDLLVLAHARHFTGFFFSSFTWAIQVSGLASFKIYPDPKTVPNAWPIYWLSLHFRSS